MSAGTASRFTLEAVTPLFLSGAEPRGAPELRAPAFRGALRYWLRAALGGVVGAHLEAVRAEEAAVFGSVDGQIARASPVVVRIEHGILPKPTPYERQDSVVVTKGGQQLRQPSGRTYLYWSMDESGKREKGNYQPRKQSYPPGTRFDLVLIVRGGIPDADRVMNRAAAALWLLAQLGGVGSRSRRTGGSLSVAGECGFEGVRFQLDANEVKGLADELGMGLTSIRRMLGKSVTPCSIPPSPEFDVFHPSVCRVWVLGVWRSWTQAVDAIGVRMWSFRSRGEGSAEVAEWLEHGRDVGAVDRAAFGLPLRFQYGKGGPFGTVQGYLPHGLDIDRRASPLWLRVSKTMQGGYAGVATLFKSSFLPQGASLRAVRPGGSPPLVDPPHGYALIESWVAESFPECQEVPYA